MLDITLFRVDQGGNPDMVRESQRRRYADVTLVDKVIEQDEEWRKSEWPASPESNPARSHCTHAHTPWSHLSLLPAPLLQHAPP